MVTRLTGTLPGARINSCIVLLPGSILSGSLPVFGTVGIHMQPSSVGEGGTHMKPNHCCAVNFCLAKTAAQVHKASWYQYHYGAETPKRLYAFSNSRHVSSLNQGQLLGWAAKKKVLKDKGKSQDLVVHYDDSQGKRRWKGTKALRASESGS